VERGADAIAGSVRAAAHRSCRQRDVLPLPVGRRDFAEEKSNVISRFSDTIMK